MLERSDADRAALIARYTCGTTPRGSPSSLWTSRTRWARSRGLRLVDEIRRKLASRQSILNRSGGPASIRRRTRSSRHVVGALLPEPMRLHSTGASVSPATAQGRVTAWLADVRRVERGDRSICRVGHEPVQELVVPAPPGGEPIGPGRRLPHSDITEHVLDGEHISDRQGSYTHGHRAPGLLPPSAPLGVRAATLEAGVESARPPARSQIRPSGSFCRRRALPGVRVNPITSTSSSPTTSARRRAIRAHPRCRDTR